MKLGPRVTEGPNMLFLMCLFAAASASVTNCGSNSVFQITQLILDPPNTVKSGDNVSLTLLYTSPVEVDSGTITTSVTYNFLPLTPTTAPLCSSVPCPIGVGDHDGSSWFLVPTGVRGTVVTKIVWTDVNSTQLLCISINMKASWF
jgi:type 1 fimbria pilin